MVLRVIMWCYRLHKDYITLSVHRRTDFILGRVAEIKGMRGKGTLLNFIAELFVNGMDLGLGNPDVDISVLKELYGKWSLTVHPYGEAKNE